MVRAGRCPVRTSQQFVAALALLFLISWMVACNGGPQAIDGELAIITPNETVPLARVVEFTTHAPAVATVTVSDGSREWTVPTPESLSIEHSVPIIGMRPATTHTVTVAIHGEAGDEQIGTVTATFDTAPLPEDFPPIEVKVSDPSRMEPGLTVFPVSRWYEGGQDLGFGLVVAVDESGEVVWYYRTDHMVSDLNLTDRGTIQYQSRRSLVEMDVLGNIIETWYASGLVDEVPANTVPVATDLFHHEIIELPSGEMLTLGTEIRAFEDFPLSATDPQNQRGRATLVGDTAIQFRRDGSIAREWKLLDLLDPYRLGHGSLGGFYDLNDYSHVEGGTKDWSHANGLAVDPRDGNLIISVRHQDVVVKVDRATGQLMWILGDPDGWTGRWEQYLLRPEGNLVWPYHQHSPTITSRGTLLLYDNGNYKSIPPGVRLDPVDNYSRVVEYEIDEEAMTLRQVWAYGEADSERFYTPFLGDADSLPLTGNILVTAGGFVVDAEGTLTDFPGAGWHKVRIHEMTRTSPPETVFDLVIDEGMGVETRGWSVYRAARWERLQ